MADGTASYTLRPATAADCQRLAVMKARAFEEYIRATWGAYDENEQVEMFRWGFDPGDFQVIVVDDEVAGFLQTETTPEVIRVRNIVVASEVQNRGVGSAVMRDLLEDADRPVWLRVLKVNPAKKFWERLGFNLVGENEDHWWAMQWQR